MRILFVCALVLSISTQASASSVQGEMAVSVIDPFQMSKMEAKMFCIENDYTRKCQALEKKWAKEMQERRQNRKLVRYKKNSQHTKKR